MVTVTTVLEPLANVPLTADKFNQDAVALAVQFSEMLPVLLSV
jgi:hypothetical protein